METSLLRAPSGRLRTPWRLVFGTVFLFLASIVGTAAFLAIDRAFFDFGAAVSTVGAVTGGGIAITVAVFIVARFLDHRSVRGFGLAANAGWRRDLAVGLALGGGLLAGLYLVGVGIGVYRPRVAPTAPPGLSVPGGFALVAMFMIVVGFYEELVFRGYFLTNFAEGLTAIFDTRLSVAGAVALSSLAFGAVHGSNPNMTAVGVATIVLAGVLLALGYVLTGRLALPVGFHITWNFGHFVFGLPVSGFDLGLRLVATDRAGSALVHGGAVGPEGGLLGLGATLVGCMAVVGYGRWIGDGLRTDIAAPPPQPESD